MLVSPGSSLLPFLLYSSTLHSCWQPYAAPLVDELSFTQAQFTSRSAHHRASSAHLLIRLNTPIFSSHGMPGTSSESKPSFPVSLVECAWRSEARPIKSINCHYQINLHCLTRCRTCHRWCRLRGQALQSTFDYGYTCHRQKSHNACRSPLSSQARTLSLLRMASGRADTRPLHCA